MESPTIHIGLIEDQFLFRKGIKAILGSYPGVKVVFEAEEGYSILERLKQSTLLPDVMLVDISLPANGKDEFSGIDVLKALQEHYPAMRVLMLSAHAEEALIARLIELGAHGYLVKDSDPDEVYEAILAASHRGSYINEKALKAIQSNLGRKKRVRVHDDQLTIREIEVLQLVCQQYTAEEIAEKLFISVKTVNGHRNNLLQKTGSRNVTGLVMYAIKNKLIEPD